MSVLQSAIDAIDAESVGLARLREALTCDATFQNAFTEATQLILSMRGRLVVSGIGKSGHVGRKIQATLASTGTPSLFLHPAEAAHGDLGMVRQDDVLLLISYSGETGELVAVIEHAIRNNLSVIAMTGHAQSTLARASRVLLLLPMAAEACPMGLAPTTSTLMQLALGDALAVSLLQKRQFSAHDFGAFHPGGKLGTALRPISQLMHSGAAMPLGRPDMTLTDVIVEMTRKTFGCIGIIDDERRLIGLISDGDLRPALSGDLKTRTARDIMNVSPLTTEPSRLAQEVLQLMTERARPVSSVFILDESGRPQGIVHLHDLLRVTVP
ncbi:KpsF/GutQ family sugar-phosphate isomerase [Candidatus Kirkpatrickella diaphorinae]|uniref:KpsF/GutQ family sugar-phosphate isomerase n=1 Tax=Candidatus Kirkpatrickella diaphorinae TaxID=2984322 RepID=A0ABY6GKV0_9PROT|nr:KpsF/GutQ family sugar-phosphate isomerase [Candidatus Kirkpatrickella diaphorinae]UYH52172.1 KpsF/GutQ family sugar-phosphate isomerase [Candidatus Kirkpatrickella diaphorinae]